MGLIVQKYGGSSVGSVERIQAVAKRVLATSQAGNSLVVVVSAMGKTTDGLVKLANEIATNPCRREMDMLLSTGEQVTIALLSMALQELGQPAISLTGAQVGILTEPAHTRARILAIETQRIQRHLETGQVVVVAGFQGVANIEDLEVTTLGRGGSDTSAVALAAALKADLCEIYTDVPGILTTDPRLIPDAQWMDEITCDEMLELASLGAKVLHPRAVEIARNYGVQMVVRSSWTDQPGTRVVSPLIAPRPLHNLELGLPVDSVQFDTQQARVALSHVPDRPGVAAQLFGELAQKKLNVDLILQSIHEKNTNDIAFTVQSRDLEAAKAVAAAAFPQQPETTMPLQVWGESEIAKISIVGAGMIGRPGIAAKMFATLGEAGVNLQMISTSEVNVSCTIAFEDCDKAIQALCQTFAVSSSPVPSPEWAADYPPVRGVALDLNQARIAIWCVPDRPGMAAKIFQLLADANISIDMIIQAQRSHIKDGQRSRDIAFTIPQADAEHARNLLKQAAPELGYADVWVNSEIAKVSIVGAGMVGHPGVAAQMFAALAEQNINIQMIATSEIRVSCLVAKEQGVEALRVIHAAFNLGSGQQFEVPA
jgi:aspartate kinase